MSISLECIRFYSFRNVRLFNLEASIFHLFQSPAVFELWQALRSKSESAVVDTSTTADVSVVAQLQWG